jgi:sugar O-acyltransferase (sialic acid O-acetyltransferase NeuD family)
MKIDREYSRSVTLNRMNLEPSTNKTLSAGSQSIAAPTSAPPATASCESEAIVLGIGGHAKVIISVLQALNYRIVEAYDDNSALWGAQVLGVPVVGPLSAIGNSRRPAVIGFGDNHLRQKIAAAMPLKWLTLVHPSAVVHESVQLGAGTVVFAGAIIQPDCTLGEHVIVNTGAGVDHDCVVGDFAHISPGAHLAGGVQVGAGAFLGIGSVAIPRTHIGDWTTVGAGGVVVRDLPPDVIAIGVPAHWKTRPHPEPAQAFASVMPTAAETAPDVRAEFIAPDDARWMNFLKQAPHDFYHLPQYVQLEAEQAGGQASAFYAEQGDARFLVPLVLSRSPLSRDVSPAWLDATSPYGYPCPLLLPAGDADQLQVFLDAFREMGTANSIVTAFLRLHPLLPLPAEPLKKVGQLIRHGAGVYFDLALGNEETERRMRGNHRHDIKQLRKAGFEVRFDEWEYYPDFMIAYDATMQRLNAERRYFFSKNYFERLKTALGERLHLGMIFAPNGEVAAGGLFTTTCGITQCHLLGTSNAYHRRSPTKLLIHVAQEWARQRDEKFLFLGGGVGGREDSLFTYKAGFVRGRADFYSFRTVLDPVKYQQLIERWRQAGGQILPGDDFFPLYRRPLDG